MGYRWEILVDLMQSEDIFGAQWEPMVTNGIPTNGFDTAFVVANSFESMTESLVLNRCY